MTKTIVIKIRSSKKINMANSEQLSKKITTLGGGKTLTKTANKMDKLITSCVEEVKQKLENFYHRKINLIHEKILYLKDMVSKLRKVYPEENWFYHFETSTIKPDEGILYIVDKNNKKYPIFIAEQKSQGTNDRILQETGKNKQKVMLLND